MSTRPPSTASTNCSANDRGRRCSGSPPYDTTTFWSSTCSSDLVKETAGSSRSLKEIPPKGLKVRGGSADAGSEAQAAEILGIKGFPAKKALTQYRRLGGDGVRRAIELLAGADLDLRGRRDLDGDVVMEILVARLSRLRR